MKLGTALTGISGEVELNRLLGVVGVLSYIFTACGLESWEVLHNHRAFDLAIFCTAFPAGLGVAIAAIAGAVALKDRNVARAQVTQAEAGAGSAQP